MTDEELRMLASRMVHEMTTDECIEAILAERARAHAEGKAEGWGAARRLALQEITQLADNAKHDMWAHSAFVQAHKYVFRALNAEGAHRSLIPAAPEVIK